jgi:hypothetical protein
MRVGSGEGMPSLEHQLLLMLHRGWQNGVCGGDFAFSLLVGYA